MPTPPALNSYSRHFSSGESSSQPVGRRDEPASANPIGAGGRNANGSDSRLPAHQSVGPDSERRWKPGAAVGKNINEVFKSDVEAKKGRLTAALLDAVKVGDSDALKRLLDRDSSPITWIPAFAGMT